ncbi:hypothetical protein HWV62_3350 [Athelia sp. TMB]|nr:hypothetical protein HWV62_3350 [Athelia sp. TMB]
MLRHNSHSTGSRFSGPARRLSPTIVQEQAAIKASVASQPCMDLERALAAIPNRSSRRSDLSPHLVALLDNAFSYRSVWTKTRMRIAENTSLLSAAEMYNMLENARLGTDRPHRDTLETVLAQLIIQNDHVEASEWWDRLRGEGIMTSRGVQFGICALVPTGRISEALEVCEAIVKMSHDAATGAFVPTIASQYKSSVGSFTYPEEGYPVASFRRGLGALIESIHRINRPDMVMQIYDNIQLLYGPCISVRTLDVIMHAAYRAIAANPAWLSWRPTELDIQRHHEPQRFPTRRDALLYLINAAEYIPPIDAFKWRGAHPGLVGRQIFHTVLYAEAPHLAFTKSPIPVPFCNPLERNLLENVPTTRAFRLSLPKIWTQFIRLLGRSHLSAEVPLVLAWMRALRVSPDPDTLGTAHGLVLQSMGPQAYGALTKWTQDWQGPDWKLKYGIEHWMFQTGMLMKGVYTPPEGPAAYPFEMKQTKKHFPRY